MLATPAFPGQPRGKITPSTTTAIVLNGGAPTFNATSPFNATAGNTSGDTLNLDLSVSYANPNAVAILSTVGGLAITTGYQNINFSDIEAINFCDAGVIQRVRMGDLYIRGTESADIIQFAVSSQPNVSNTRVNSSNYYLAVTTKTIVFARRGNDNVQQGSLTKPAEFHGEMGNDYLAGYTANDLIVGGPGADRVLGNQGNNELWGDNLLEQNLLSGGDDILSSGNGHDVIYAGGGNDSVTASAGIDYVYGGAGNDTIDGGLGDDRLYGGEGNDTISGHDGNDLLAGNAGLDKLYGQFGNDLLIAGSGANYLVADVGNDLLYDGQVSTGSPAKTDDSIEFGDANDAAMLALLTDWPPMACSRPHPPAITTAISIRLAAASATTPPPRATATLAIGKICCHNVLALSSCAVFVSHPGHARSFDTQANCEAVTPPAIRHANVAQLSVFN